MPNYHRFASPAWLFALPIPPGPGTSVLEPTGKVYDRFNVVDNGTGAGGSAFADTQKGAGPNIGTYFVAFGDDGTSSNTNRGFAAMAENLDYIDDQLHNSLAVEGHQDVLVVGPPVSSVVILGTEFPYLGSPGDTIDDLFRITDIHGNQLFVPGAGAVEVASVIGPAIGSGFTNVNITLNLNMAIPAGVGWSGFRVHYRKHKYLGNTGPDPLGRWPWGTSSLVMQQLFAILGHVGPTDWWTTPPTSSIYDLALSGLNERYRRSTSVDLTSEIPTGSGLPSPLDSTANNVEGAGSWFKRLGPAMSGWTQRNLAGALPPGQSFIYLDPLDAIWTARIEDVRTGATPQGYGGSTGFASYGSKRGSVYGNAPTDFGAQPGFAKYMGLSQRDEFTKTDVGLFTRVTKDSTVTFNVVGPNVELTLAGGDYFHRLELGVNRTAVVPGSSMLEIEHDDGTGVIRRRTYVVSLLDVNPLKCRLIQIDGANPIVLNGATGTLRRVLSLDFFVGDGVDEYRQGLGLSSGSLPRGFIYAAQPPTTSTPLMDVDQAYAQFYGVQSSIAVAWGFVETDVASSARNTAVSALMSNGDVEVVGNVRANTATAAANRGEIRGIKLSQEVQLTSDALNVATFDVRLGHTLEHDTSYGGPATFEAIQLHHVPVSGVNDYEILLVVKRTNPATTLAQLSVVVFSDAGVTAMDAYMDGNLGPFPSILLNAAPVGVNGSVDVLRGRVVNSTVYWETVVQTQL